MKLDADKWEYTLKNSIKKQKKMKKKQYFKYENKNYLLLKYSISLFKIKVRKNKVLTPEFFSKFKIIKVLFLNKSL